jgi:hypothetical protein
VGTAFGPRRRPDRPPVLPRWGVLRDRQPASPRGVPADRWPSRRRYPHHPWHHARFELSCGDTFDPSAGDCAGDPPFFVRDPLSTETVAADRLTEWFRETIAVRDADEAERVPRTTMRVGLAESAVAGMLAAATDHRCLDPGHRLDFCTEALETLDHAGWDRAADVLPGVVSGQATAARAEDPSSWREPVDVAGLCADAAADLPDLLDRGEGVTRTEPEGFVDRLLGADPPTGSTH